MSATSPAASAVTAASLPFDFTTEASTDKSCVTVPSFSFPLSLATVDTLATLTKPGMAPAATAAHTASSALPAARSLESSHASP